MTPDEAAACIRECAREEPTGRFLTITGLVGQLRDHRVIDEVVEFHIDDVDAIGLVDRYAAQHAAELTAEHAPGQPYAAGKPGSVEPDRERELLRAVVDAYRTVGAIARERAMDDALAALAEHDRAAGRKEQPGSVEPDREALARAWDEGLLKGFGVLQEWQLSPSERMSRKGNPYRASGRKEPPK